MNSSEIAAEIESLSDDLDVLWTILSLVLVLFMQSGFAMLEAGATVDNHVENILMKNLLDVSVSALCWLFVGYPIAFGAQIDGKEEWKDWYFDSSNFDSVSWLFSWAFAAASATIVSGAVAERVNLWIYLVYCAAMVTFLYPMVVRLTWGGGPFAAHPTAIAWGGFRLFSCGTMDFAGSGIVHMTAAVAAVVVAVRVGPRRFRFKMSRTSDVITVAANEGDGDEGERGSSTGFQALGTFLLWLGWYGFNAGSTLGIAGQSSVVSHIIMTTTMAAVAGLLASCLFGGILRQVRRTDYFKQRFKLNIRGQGRTQAFYLPDMLNGALAGLVSITAGCHIIPIGYSIAAGGLAAIVFHIGSLVLQQQQVDDVINAIPVHGYCGALGLILAVLFADEDRFRDYLEIAGYGSDQAATVADRCIGDRYRSLGATVVFIICVTFWICLVLNWALELVRRGSKVSINYRPEDDPAFKQDRVEVPLTGLTLQQIARIIRCNPLWVLAVTVPTMTLKFLSALVVHLRQEYPHCGIFFLCEGFCEGSPTTHERQRTGSVKHVPTAKALLQSLEFSDQVIWAFEQAGYRTQAHVESLDSKRFDELVRRIRQGYVPTDNGFSFSSASLQFDASVARLNRHLLHVKGQDFFVSYQEVNEPEGPPGTITMRTQRQLPQAVAQAPVDFRAGEIRQNDIEIITLPPGGRR
uniref:Ammonium transporter AmtB-like domain-containing protein n=1 Tax=Rhizochromulina marina TaxID=1034831 RepID=A0A7S2S369_9STRA|mmetsp:Transcript_24178/g.70967  ORF Transcript_24178/g.70967 Transcript_24178/m.70967 type:complete len:692 (+) Transcript_24178:134-2209(+)